MFHIFSLVRFLISGVKGSFGNSKTDSVVFEKSVVLLEDFAFNRSVWSSNKEKACFSGRCRPHLQLFTLMR